jgi:hypothetical protein
MWKKQDDAEDAQPEFAPKQRTDMASLGDALAKSLTNNTVPKEDFPVVSEKVVAGDSNQLLPSTTMKTYTELVKEFTKNATAFIEQLPLLTKARAAYEEAMKASAEMRKVLDTNDRDLRTLMTQLEQKTNLQDFESFTDKRPPEAAKVETMRATHESRDRALRWP